MQVSDLDYEYPEDLVARTPSHPCRVMQVSITDRESFQIAEISLQNLLEQMQPGDLLVVNDTQVLKRRVFSEEGLEFLFLKSLGERDWQVLFPAKKWSVGHEFKLPRGVIAQLLEKGLPQKVRLSRAVSEDYFSENGEVPLPPYIQKARGERHTQKEDDHWYQTLWAQKPGSFAAPTASLHFSQQDLDYLKFKGVQMAQVTLHVGLGTFLPVSVADLNDHAMHSEWVEVPRKTWEAVQEAKHLGGRVWALGTTVTRSLESVAQKKIPETQDGFAGFTDLLIQEGFEFQVVDCLMTNFHQPKSTLLALVAGFAGLSTTKKAYAWALARRFRLFSYGDLTLWTRNSCAPSQL